MSLPGPTSEPPTAIPTVPLPAAVPDQPTPCVHCGYDLRTLPAHGLCPECATPIQTTLVPLESMSRRDWSILLRGLRRVRLVNSLEILPAITLFALLELQHNANPWLVCTLALSIACAAIPRAHGYTLIAQSAPKNIADALRERARWRLAVLPNAQIFLRLALVMVIIASYLTDSDGGLMGGILAVGICAALLVQYAAFMDVLAIIRDAQPAPYIQDVRRLYGLLIPVSLVVMLLFRGLGLIACWTLYLLMLCNLIDEARRRTTPTMPTPAPQ